MGPNPRPGVVRGEGGRVQMPLGEHRLMAEAEMGGLRLHQKRQD